MDHLQPDYLRVHEKDADLDLSLAIAYSGDLQYELVQQHNATPSPYKDFLDSRGEGLHHLCTWSENFDADLARWTANGHRNRDATYGGRGCRLGRAKPGPVVCKPHGSDRLTY
jgi:hypothetical protein